MEKVIPWDSGGGNIHLTYTGQGNSSIVITSDSENYTGETRTKLITINTSRGGTVYSFLGHLCPSSYFINLTFRFVLINVNYSHFDLVEHHILF